MEGHVQTAAWSPCGTKAVFADSAQPTLYCISVDRMSPLGEKNMLTLKVIYFFFRFRFLLYRQCFFVFFFL